MAQCNSSTSVTFLPTPDIMKFFRSFSLNIFWSLSKQSQTLFTSNICRKINVTGENSPHYPEFFLCIILCDLCIYGESLLWCDKDLTWEQSLETFTFIFRLKTLLAFGAIVENQFDADASHCSKWARDSSCCNIVRGGCNSKDVFRFGLNRVWGRDSTDDIGVHWTAWAPTGIWRIIFIGCTLQ